MPKKIVRDTETKMKKAIGATSRDFSTIRAGRASPSMLDNVQVNYYGTKTSINKMATITTPEPRLLVIQPWDVSNFP